MPSPNMSSTTEPSFICSPAHLTIEQPERLAALPQHRVAIRRADHTGGDQEGRADPRLQLSPDQLHEIGKQGAVTLQLLL
jgi:hypothetical protein